MTRLRETLYFVLCLLVGVSALSGCIEDYEADISSDDSNLLVVEGAICSDQLNKFYLSRTQTVNSSASPQMETGALVSVRGTDGTEYKAQQADGYYACQVGTLSSSVAYYLHIETAGEVYESDPQQPLATEKIAEVRAVQTTPESNIDVLVTPAEPFHPDKQVYYLWTCNETWEVRPDYTTTLYYDTKLQQPVAKSNLYPERGWKDATLTSIMVGSSRNYEGQHIRLLKMYDIDSSGERVYYKYSGLVCQRAITKAEYEYELARRQASSEMGGLFTPLPSALPTNIHCLTSQKHVIGYVGCSLNTSEYRFFINPLDFTIHRPVQIDNRKWLDNTTHALCMKMIESGYFLCEWDDTQRSSTGAPIIRSAWAYKYQLDVRLRGAYTEEPEYWSLNENVSY